MIKVALWIEDREPPRIDAEIEALPHKGDLFFVDGAMHDVIRIEHRFMTERPGTNIMIFIQPRDMDVYRRPVEGNGAIDQAPEGTIDGWRRAATWQYDAASSGAVGDDTVGRYFEGRYARPVESHHLTPQAPTYRVVTLAFYVRETDRNSVYEVCLQRCSTLCTDPEDPGSSEISSEYTHELDIVHTSFLDLATAEAVARALALVDARLSFLTAPMWKELDELPQ